MKVQRIQSQSIYITSKNHPTIHHNNCKIFWHIKIVLPDFVTNSNFYFVYSFCTLYETTSNANIKLSVVYHTTIQFGNALIELRF